LLQENIKNKSRHTKAKPQENIKNESQRSNENKYLALLSF